MTFRGREHAQTEGSYGNAERPIDERGILQTFSGTILLFMMRPRRSGNRQSHGRGVAELHPQKPAQAARRRAR